MIHFPVIPSKLLLFGEHSVLVGLPAVTLPLWDFTSRLKFSGSGKQEMQSGLMLKEFARYLQQENDFKKAIDVDKLIDLINQGLYLDSDIPAGYGLGSSANVCVAVYKAFNFGISVDTAYLKDFYGKMESYYHGKSSGIDPLVVHAEKPLMVNSSGIGFLNDDVRFPEGMNIYLLNSGIPRNAADMVNTFRQLYEDADYRKNFHRHYQPALEKITNTILNGERVSYGMLRELSFRQLQFFRKMIPESLLNIWQQHLSDDTAYFKILGAGGGGFFLVFSMNGYKEIDGYNLIRVNL